MTVDYLYDAVNYFYTGGIENVTDLILYDWVTIFFDDFNRDDGVVDNGWTTITASSPAQDAVISSNRLEMEATSATSNATGIWRPLEKEENSTICFTYNLDFGGAGATSRFIPFADDGIALGFYPYVAVGASVGVSKVLWVYETAVINKFAVKLGMGELVSVKVEISRGTTTAGYKAKIWETGEDEPVGWDVENTGITIGYTVPADIDDVALRTDIFQSAMSIYWDNFRAEEVT
ncbi:MAG: hypothetical protein GY861_15940 [bacterium]|nr:hypothetical protein [bacterium]